jgi:arabinose-5-phosphate isomerase
LTRPISSVNILAEIERVLDIEIEALQSVRATLDGRFAEAVEIIAACKGQVVLTGVGKSGIIATKIAATFRSTGTPATFLHAGEALHGDAGTVRSGDIVIAVGKSGQTSELNMLLRILKSNGIFVISITSTPASAMAALSDLVLDLKIAKEACPLNLAPTASTTAALAVGDALAVALMKLKNVSEADFARHHPGGQLGKRLLLRVDDVMRKGDQNPILLIGSSVQEMLVQITAFRVGAISIVTDEGKLAGLVTDYDIRKMLESGRDIFSMRISEVMNASPSVLHSDEKAIDALDSMRQRSKPTAVMPVLNREEKVVGMVHLHDLISAGL